MHSYYQILKIYDPNGETKDCMDRADDWLLNLLHLKNRSK